MDVLPAAVRRRLSPNWAYGARLVVLILAVAALGIGIGSAVKTAAESARWASGDIWIAKTLHSHACGTWLWRTALGLSVLGWPLFFYVTIGALIVFLLFRREFALILYFVVTALTGGIVDTIVKEVVNRPRPQLAGCTVGLSGKSFPSGHLMTATISYGMLLLALLPLVRTQWRRRALVGLAVFALCAIAFARSVVGAHFASDILAGFVLGLLWLAAATWVYARWRSESGRVPSAVPGGGVAPDVLARLRPR